MAGKTKIILIIFSSLFELSVLAQNKQELTLLFAGDMMQHGAQLEAAYESKNC